MKQATSDPLSGRLFTIRGQRVILDADLARLYGAATKRFNEAFKRNAARFPQDFCFQLTAREFAALRSQIATLESGLAREAGTWWWQSLRLQVPAVGGTGSICPGLLPSMAR